MPTEEIEALSARLDDLSKHADSRETRLLLLEKQVRCIEHSQEIVRLRDAVHKLRGQMASAESVAAVVQDVKQMKEKIENELKPVTETLAEIKGGQRTLVVLVPILVGLATFLANLFKR